jgi:hypothetical protein
MLGEVRNHVTTVRNNRPDLIGKPKDEIENHFSTIFNKSNWLKCWYYMDGYIEFRDYTDLGKWYMQYKSFSAPPPPLSNPYWISSLFYHYATNLLILTS